MANSGDSQDVAQLLADAARDFEAAPGTQATLDEVCDRAVAVIAGCRRAGIIEARREQRGRTLATTSPASEDLHDLQYQLGDGPCVTALWHDRVVWSDDLAEEQRWPKFAAAAVERGIRSALGIQLYTHADTLGALNLYSDTPGAFDEVTRDVAQVFAAHAAVAIAEERGHAELARALVTRQQIGQATGILAERHQLTTDEAFTLLVRASQNSNTRLRDLAARLVASENDVRRRSRSPDA
ncbi:MAG: ANTAR domain-containing protein [Streptosporangiales bacterium]|nr:ANTAR domain-containing protein [Streptosporangiales bacterium]